MALQAGIVGLPNVGKSTLFNAVSNSAKAQASNYRFCTIDPNVGLVDVPDPRLNKLAELVVPDRIVPTQISENPCSCRLPIWSYWIQRPGRSGHPC